METARALTENLVSLLRREHEALAEFLIALADFDRRRAWVEMGHSSLFYFLHRELGLSLGAAQHRKVAAELIQKVPGAIEPLRRGQLCLTSIIEVAKVVTAENWEVILPRFYGLSRREATEVVAELQPHPTPPVRTLVTQIRSTAESRKVAAGSPVLTLEERRESRMLDPSDFAAAGDSLGPISPGEMGRPLITPCAPASVGFTSPAGAGTSVTSASLTAPAASATSAWQAARTAATSAAPATSAAGASSATVARPLEVIPLTAEQSRVHLTVTKGFVKKLDAARDALSHAMPGATPAELLEAGLDLLLAQATKRKGLVERPQKKVRAMNGDGIPAHVKREVWKRDNGRCQWKLASGGTCGSTRDLEFDHIHPRSLGGPSTVENLRVVCGFHNRLAARRLLGDELMDRYTSDPRAATSSPP